MSDQFTPSTELFRAVYAHMLAEWCREDSLAEFDRLIDQERRRAKATALREVANDLHDLDPKGDAVFWDGEYYVFVHGWLHYRADQLEQEGKNDE